LLLELIYPQKIPIRPIVNKLLILTLIFLFIGCSQERPKTYAKLSVSSKSFTADNNEQVILYAINKDKNEQQALILDQNAVGLDLEFGNWQFVTLAWEEDDSSQIILKCGKASKNFNQVEDSLSIYMSSENCNDDLFASSDFRSYGSIKDLQLINCQDITGLTTGQYCNNSDRGFAGSYRLSVLGHPQMSRNSLLTINPTTAAKISSECIFSIGTPSSITNTGMKIPLGSSDFKMPVLVEVFEGGSCEGVKKEYFLPNGPSTPLPGTRAALLNSEESADLYLEYGKIYLQGPTSFGQRLINQTANMSVVFKNSSSVALSDFSATIETPFTIVSNSCGSNIPPKGSCSLVLSFFPSEESEYSNNLVLNYKKEGIQQSLTQSITGNGVTNMAPVTTGFHFGSVLEDSNLAVPLSFTDFENDTPTSCTIDTKSHLTVISACTCNTVQCFVTLKGEQNYSGPASFTYSVVTNGMTSNTSSVSVTFTPQDDPPVVNVFSPQPADEDFQKMIMLTYYDAEGEIATSCNVESLSNVTVTQACTCTSGICMVGLTGVSEFSGIASFSYSVEASNGVSSNVQSISYSIMPLDDAPVVQSVISLAGNEDASINVQLPFVDAEGDAPSACSVTNLLNLSMASPCSCQANICSVGVKGSSNYSGEASFKYSVTANGKTSNVGTGILSISPMDDAPVITSVTPGNFNEDAVTTLNISYSDVENNVPSICHIQSVTSLSIVQACTCSSGQCSMQVIGSPANFSGYAYMSLNLTANDLTSQSFNTMFLINSVDDAPVVTDIYPTGVFEDTLKTITFTYTDVDGPSNAICNLSSPSNTVFAGPCTCASNTCTASFKSIQDYNGPGSFNYTVTTNNVTSNTGTVSFTYQAVDDAPVARNLSFVYPASEYVELKYDDKENNPASACIILDAVGPTPSCSCNDGICVAEYYQSPTGADGIAGFSYKVVANGVESQLAHVIMTSPGINTFQSLPLKQTFSGYNGLPSNFIFDVFVDNSSGSEVTYLATGKGLAISSDGGSTFEIRNVSHGLGSNKVNAVFVDDGNVYAATSGGLSISNDGGNSFTNKDTSAGLSSNEINDVFVYNSNIYLATAYGVSISHNNASSFTSTLLSSDFQTQFINKIFVTGNGVYAATSNGLAISSNDGSTFSRSAPTVNSIIRSVYELNGTIYVATANGVHFSNDNGSTYTMISNLSSNSTFDLFGSNGTLYIGTTSGVSIYQDNSVTNNTINTTSGVLNIRSVFSLNGKIFVGTEKGFAVAGNSSSNFVFTENLEDLSHYLVKDVIAKDGGIYAATPSGLSISFDNGKSFINKNVSNGLPTNLVNAIDMHEGILYLATSSGFVISYDKGTTFTTRDTTNGLPSNIINDILVLPNGTIYAATSAGWAYSNNRGLSFVSLNSGVANTSIRAIFAESNGAVYLGTNSGLLITNNNGQSYIQKTITDGLASNSINSIAKKNELLVVGTSSGLSVSLDSGSTYVTKSSNDGLPAEFINNVVIKNEVILVSTAMGFAYSTDFGHSFFIPDRNLGIGSYHVSAATIDNSGIIYVGTDSGIYTSISNVFLTWRDANGNHISSFDFGDLSSPSNVNDQVFLKNVGNVPANSAGVGLEGGTASVQAELTILDNIINPNETVSLNFLFYVSDFDYGLNNYFPHASDTSGAYARLKIFGTIKSHY
jgi:ligand-binding sensor domain-containing protein